MNKNKSKESGFVNLIILIVVALLLARHYHLSIDDVVEWFKSLSVDKVMAWFKDFAIWCTALLDSVLAKVNMQ